MIFEIEVACSWTVGVFGWLVALALLADLNFATDLLLGAGDSETLEDLEPERLARVGVGDWESVRNAGVAAVFDDRHLDSVVRDRALKIIKIIIVIIIKPR